jgi:hypothetical protein
MEEIKKDNIGLSELDLGQKSIQTNLAEAEINLLEPGKYRVVRRNGSVTSYDSEKIKIAMTKAFLAVEGSQAAASSRIHNITEELTQVVHEKLIRRLPEGGTFHIEDIQDQVELSLMRSGEHMIMSLISPIIRMLNPINNLASMLKIKVVI